MGRLPRSLIGEHRRVERVGGIALAVLQPQLPPIKMVDFQGMEKATIASPTGLGANCLSGTLPPNAFTTNSFPPTT
jgi:hypothetical protein